MRVGIVDVGMGNLHSVESAIRRVGGDVYLIRTAEALASAERVVFPGQGAFGPFMNSIDSLGMRQPLVKHIRDGKPYLGICLGLQALYQSSDESPGAIGLGVYSGHVKKFTHSDLRVPHMGWNHVDGGPSELSGKHYYFVHSYFVDGKEDQIMTAKYGVDFTAAIQRENLFACQFHPEKSQEAGLAVLGHYLK